MDFLAIPFGYLLRWCYMLVPNYAVALLIFTLATKLILFPVGIKQQKNMVKQASLRPKEKALRDRYSGQGNSQKLQEELMKLYQSENYSPYGGCLPMILTLVIVLAVYQAVLNPLRFISHVPKDNISNINYRICELYSEGNLKTEGLSESVIKTLDTYRDKIKEDTADSKTTVNFRSGKDTVKIIRLIGVDLFKGEGMLDETFTENDLTDFTLFGGAIDLSEYASISKPSLLWILVGINLAVSLASIWINKKLMYQPPKSDNAPNAELSTKIMQFTMPAITTFIAFQVPAILVLYWIYQSVLALVQQFILKLMYPFPEFSEEDYKAASRELYKPGKAERLDRKKTSGKVAAHRIDLLPEEQSDDENEDRSGKGDDGGVIPPAKLKD